MKINRTEFSLFICSLLVVLFAFVFCFNFAKQTFLSIAISSNYDDFDICNSAKIVTLENFEKEEYLYVEKDVIAPQNLEFFGDELSQDKISLGEFILTAYCSCEKCCGRWANDRPVDENGNQLVYGSTGILLVPGLSIAVDPDVIPYRSQVEINGHIYIAHDCGGAIKGNRIDVYFDNHKDALEFGVQKAEIYLVEETRTEDCDD